MEKQLIENPKEIWKLVWIYATFPLALMVINIFVTGDIVFSAECALIIICAVGIFQWLSYRDSGQRPVWFLTDNGLKCVDVSRGQEIITWEQIFWMKWMRYVGLMIQWKAPHSSESKAPQERLRARIGINREDAQEILAVWKKMNSTVGAK